MSPDLGSGRDDKLLNKRLQRRSMRVDSPLSKPNILSKIKTPSPLVCIIMVDLLMSYRV